jgi:hypothetical protein
MTDRPQPPVVHVTTAPAVSPPRWSGKKTAVAAALAIGLSGGIAAGAAYAVPASNMTTRDAHGGPGGRGFAPGSFRGQPGGQLPGQLPGQAGRTPTP